MTIAWFVTINGPEEQREGAAQWFRENVLAGVKGQLGVQSMDLFTAEKSQDPHLDDGAGPLLMAQVDFDKVINFENLLTTSGLQNSFFGNPEQLPYQCSAVQGAYRTIDQVVASETEIQPRTAPMSYVVRYYRPAEDEAAFTGFYVAHHPQILADLPKIRNVYCYLPVTWKNTTKIGIEDCMLGNEVVFDSLGDLNASLKSDVRHRLREDYHQFPTFTGPNSHFAMARQRVFES